MSILLGNGNGTLAAAVPYPVATNPNSVATGDLNGDGKPDLAVGSVQFVSIRLGTGNGAFGAAVNYSRRGWYPYSVAIGDVNGDGKPDLAIANGNASVSILLGNGNGTFGAPVSYAAGVPTAFSGDRGRQR